ncbi:hypothetical protein N8I77_010891 [Diaporthe amygdali]|uniref:Uncharacterized protein n=1 Tax=Phomopsis amygdali TaxID=1214568 RepID=A0AAD9S7U2_PHOAM|nr:hypothetical protein N8I77_010891 [Diaporthe amygdali]
MSSTRALRLTSLASRPSLSTAYRAQAQPARSAAPAPFQTRHYAAKGDGEKDDLGGPGGQEPPDPVARAQQNRSLRNKTIAGMLVAISIPLFYMVGQPRKIAEAEVDNNSVGPFAKNNPGEKLANVQGGLPGGRQEQQNQWEENSGQGTKAVR